ncbi:protein DETOXIFICATION 29-like [Aegilops tauschii subsp. strangulata]|uniref:protein DETOXIFICATION 29-like n=1 Tax=Aegilops tauschii subsp. strangulata TaxID=200361 RepID=UPI00098B748A|nr:protein DETOXIFICATION 34-like [Aegilops tauschii subsp. strangulata]
MDIDNLCRCLLKICCNGMNYNIWTPTVAFGFNAAVRHPKAAKFSVVAAVTTSAAIGLIFTLVALVARKQLPRLFSDDDLLVKETARPGYLLAATILNSIQPALSAVFGIKLKLDVQGNMGGDADRHDSAYRHPICDSLQNQMEERAFGFLMKSFAVMQAMIAVERVRSMGGDMELPAMQETR